ncbi:phosphatase PAP2 family protein [Enterococcus sp. BWR-S5]|uniref:phosphatase PAP2 family protein n=1 Tax=Enterococcus sp. BWR-S5 TaxID=2787714 RepID=UPI0019236DC6|nr:phosphatase PAP2 family protein [Enterococcus sp. BWR-S5]MBL1223511.1 phosphatase PAP2 family protein [Enterococcus sp. BWR-S5]
MKHKNYYQFAGAFFLLLFIFIGAIVKFSPALLNSFDQSITAFIRTPYPELNQFFIWYTKLANPMTVAALAVILAGVMAVKKYYIEAFWLLLNTGFTAGILNSLIKLFFMRERPTLEHLVVEHSYSFPSGHSTGSMLLYGTIIMLLPLFIKKKTLCRVLQLLLGIGILFIGISRIYLGVHFPSDIVGGFCFGLSWLLLTYPLYQKTQLSWYSKHKHSKKEES